MASCRTLFSLNLNLIKINNKCSDTFSLFCLSKKIDKSKEFDVWLKWDSTIKEFKGELRMDRWATIAFLEEFLLSFFWLMFHLWL